jgi:hypothetical protein
MERLIGTAGWRLSGAATSTPVPDRLYQGGQRLRLDGIVGDMRGNDLRCQAEDFAGRMIVAHWPCFVLGARYMYSIHEKYQTSFFNFWEAVYFPTVGYPVSRK